MSLSQTALASEERRVILPMPHAGQQQVMAEFQRFNVLACGRRWGKTEFAQMLAVLALRGGYPVGFFAPVYKDLMDVWRVLKRVLVSELASKNEQEKRIDLRNGGSMDFWTLDNPDSGRGRKYKRLIVDEAAKARHLKEWWTEAGRPTLTDFKGDAWFLGTPKGRNYFYRLFLMGQEYTDWCSWQMPTLRNPLIDPDEVESARFQLPREAYLQEYEAAFTEDAGLVFRHVRDCVYEGEEQPDPDGKYVMGIDWAQARDFTCLVVLDVDRKRVVHIDRFNQIGWEIQRGRMAALARFWNVRTILAEQNAMGGPLIERAQLEGLPIVPFTTTVDSKADLIQALMLAFERRDINIPDDPVLIAELESFEAARLPSGKWSYSAPDGLHDDTVIALALAYRQSLEVYEDAGTLVQGGGPRFGF